MANHAAEDANKLMNNKPRLLSKDEQERLELQNNLLVPNRKAELLETKANVYWDLFYKRNETRFFKDRHWTTREFTDLNSELKLFSGEHSKNLHPVLLEVGCGVGNFIFPLIEENSNFFIYACDFSPRAIEFVRKNPLYNKERMQALVLDITTDDIHLNIERNSIHIITLIFVLSAIHPDKFELVLRNLIQVLKPGGVVLFRDYGLYDMAQVRFKPGHKIMENLYMRQDGTRSYFFSVKYLNELFEKTGFEIVTNSYVHRRTVNKKENLDVPRIFVQGKFRKPNSSYLEEEKG